MLPELFICGYPPEDLVLKPALQAACRAAVEELARETADGGPAMLIGTPWVEDGKLYNACALLDERPASPRFASRPICRTTACSTRSACSRAAPPSGPVTVKGVRVGVPICEDIWLEESEEYENVVECLAETGAEILVVPNGSPYARDKNDLRLSIAVARVTESGLPLIYLNQVGGQDELVFDGASFALNADLSVAAQLPAFEESIVTLRWTKSADRLALHGPDRAAARGRQGRLRGLRAGPARLRPQERFSGVLLGVSGGIDSALCAAIAVDALGADQVRGVMLPFRYTAQVSLDDAAKLTKALGIRYEVLPIADAVNGFEKILSGAVRRPAARHHRRESAGAHPRHAADGDLQQDRRHGGDDRQQVGNVGRLRHAVRRHEWRLQPDQGYLQDRSVPAVEPAQFVEAGRRARPLRRGDPGQSIIVRPPTAELRENQTDQDLLPPYEILDAILERLVEREEPLASIIADGFDRETVARIDRLLNIAEYKRRQAAPGVKVTREEFWPRPPLSHHQPLSRYRQGVAGAGRDPGDARQPARRRRRSTARQLLLSLAG